MRHYVVLRADRRERTKALKVLLASVCLVLVFVGGLVAYRLGVHGGPRTIWRAGEVYAVPGEATLTWADNGLYDGGPVTPAEASFLTSAAVPTGGDSDWVGSAGTQHLGGEPTCMPYYRSSRITARLIGPFANGPQWLVLEVVC